MNKVKCPKCGTLQAVIIERRPNEQEYDDKILGIKDLPPTRNQIFVGVSGYSDIYAIARCLDNDCRISYLVKKYSTHGDWKVESISPYSEKIGEGVPPLVEEAYRQALACLVIGCPDASMAMCRTSLDRMSKDKEAKGGTLETRLNDLVGKGILKSSCVTEAINVRKFGNAALHDLLSEEISKDDAEIICEFTKGVLYDIYVTPELARKAEERRLKLQGDKGKEK